MNQYITKEKAYELFKKYNTPKHVIAHCEAVNKVAVNIGNALNKSGCNLDIGIIYGASILHDLARVEEEHWNVAANILDALGYNKESKIIRVHMYYPEFNDISNIEETDIVCLADRVVKEDKYVGLDERIDYIIKKSGNNPQKNIVILKNKKKTEKLINDIESKTNMSLETIVLGGLDEHTT